MLVRVKLQGAAICVFPGHTGLQHCMGNPSFSEFSGRYSHLLYLALQLTLEPVLPISEVPRQYCTSDIKQVLLGSIVWQDIGDHHYNGGAGVSEAATVNTSCRGGLLLHSVMLTGLRFAL